MKITLELIDAEVEMLKDLSHHNDHWDQENGWQKPVMKSLGEKIRAAIENTTKDKL